MDGQWQGAALASHGPALNATETPAPLYRPGVSSTYRDDRSALLASMDALRRENDDLRAENLSLRVLVDPAPARSSLALQGALAATLVLLGAMVGAALVGRAPPAAAARARSGSFRSPRSRSRARRRRWPSRLSMPRRTSPRPRRTAPRRARARRRARCAAAHRARALARCLAAERGDLRLVIRLDAAGHVAARSLAHRRGTPVAEGAARCALDAASALRLDERGPMELRYTLRVDAAGLRVRRVRAR